MFNIYVIIDIMDLIQLVRNLSVVEMVSYLLQTLLHAVTLSDIVLHPRRQHVVKAYPHPCLYHPCIITSQLGRVEQTQTRVVH